MTSTRTARRCSRALQGAGVGLAVALLAGCGSDRATEQHGGPTADGTPTATSPSGQPGAETGSSRVATVAIVTQTAVGGTVSPDAVPLPDAAAVSAFGGQFSGDRMTAALTEVVDGAAVPEGSSLWAAVVARGCETPDEVEVARRGDGVQVTPVGGGGRAVQCLAPMTSVAVVLVPDAG